MESDEGFARSSSDEKFYKHFYGVTVAHTHIDLHLSQPGTIPGMSPNTTQTNYIYIFN